MRKLKQHPILFAELILLILTIALVVWIGLSETDEYIALQGMLLILAMILFFVMPFIVLRFMSEPSPKMKELKKKQQWEKSKEYREQYVKRVVVEHPFFGICEFEVDSNKNSANLVEGINDTIFGVYTVSADIEVSPQSINLALDELWKVYQDSDRILEQVYPAAVAQCNDWDETDLDGNEITIEYIKKYYSLEGISVSDNGSDNVCIMLEGCIEDENGEIMLGYHSFVTEIDCSTGEISYDLWG
jgi:hypothetical protein